MAVLSLHGRVALLAVDRWGQGLLAAAGPVLARVGRGGRRVGALVLDYRHPFVVPLVLVLVPRRQRGQLVLAAIQSLR